MVKFPRTSFNMVNHPNGLAFKSYFAYLCLICIWYITLTYLIYAYGFVYKNNYIFFCCFFFNVWYLYMKKIYDKSFQTTIFRYILDILFLFQNRMLLVKFIASTVRRKLCSCIGITSRRVGVRKG